MDLFSGESEPIKLKFEDETVELYYYTELENERLMNNLEEKIEDIIEKIKKDNNIVLKVIFTETNIKKHLLAEQDKYIIEFTFIRKNEVYEDEAEYKISHIYKFPDDIKSKMKVLGIKDVSKNMISKIKERCTKII